jgi:hypothetical protein
MGNCCRLVRRRKDKNPSEHADWNGLNHHPSLNSSPVYPAKKKKKSSSGSIGDHRTSHTLAKEFSRVMADGSPGHAPKSINGSKHPLIDSGNTINALGTGTTPLRSATSYENKLEDNIPHIADFDPDDDQNVPADNPRVSTLFLPKASE